jgi:hypothetical protein
MTHNFLFQKDFGQQSVDHVYDLDELEIATRQSYMEGLDAGRLQMLHEIEGDTRRLLTAIAKTLSDVSLIQQQSYINVAHIAEKIMRTLFPVFAEKGGLLEVQAVVTDVLEKLNTENKVTISCAESVAKGIKEHMDTLQTSFPLHIQGSAQCDTTDVTIDWTTGFAKRSEQALLEQIHTIMTQYKEMQHAI